MQIKHLACKGLTDIEFTRDLQDEEKYVYFKNVAIARRYTQAHLLYKVHYQCSVNSK